MWRYCENRTKMHPRSDTVYIYIYIYRERETDRQMEYVTALLSCEPPPRTNINKLLHQC